MNEELREMYLMALKENPTVFDRFVSRGDVRDPVDISNPRIEAERITSRAIRSVSYDRTPRYVPIVGTAGSGKTHFYWVLKDKQIDLPDVDYETVYVPSPPAPVRMLLHIYICVMDEIGLDILKTVSERLVTAYGGKKKRFKLFGPEMEEIIGRAIRWYPGVSADVVRALIMYQMAPKEIKTIAEWWLLGETLSEEEMEILGVSHIIEEDDMCLATLKLLAENIDQPIILYFDELEIPYRTFGDEAEIRLFETIKRLYNEVRSIIVVTACLSDVWERILDLADPATKTRMEQTANLVPFAVEDIKQFYIAAQQVFWDAQNLNPPEDLFFPLEEDIFPQIHKASEGNPREAIRLIRDALDSILFERPLPPSLISTEVVPKLRPPPLFVEADIPKAEATLIKRPESIPEEEIIAVDVNPGSIGGSAMASILTVAKNLGQEKRIKVEMEFVFEAAGKRRKLTGVIKSGSEPPIGIEVPSCKTFSRSGGVAAYYSARRLNEALETNTIARGCLIVPKGTSGNKYNQIVSSMREKALVIELSQNEAEALIRKARTHPIEQIFPLIKLFFPKYERLPEKSMQETEEPFKTVGNS
ncbi:MAG: hypothetical protein ACE5R6_00580 [Candidatus Heimdallarchaeota archaeon]